MTQWLLREKAVRVSVRDTSFISKSARRRSCTITIIRRVPQKLIMLFHRDVRLQIESGGNQDWWKCEIGRQADLPRHAGELFDIVFRTTVQVRDRQQHRWTPEYSIECFPSFQSNTGILTHERTHMDGRRSRLLTKRDNMLRP